jgi:hypothetical protein
MSSYINQLSIDANIYINHQWTPSLLESTQMLDELSTPDASLCGDNIYEAIASNLSN